MSSERVYHFAVEITCPQCGGKATCFANYDTGGSDLESVEFTHECPQCGVLRSSIEYHCYGYDNDFQCKICFRDYPVTIDRETTLKE